MSIPANEHRQQLAKEFGSLLEQAADLGKDDETLSKIQTALKDLAEARDDDTWEQIKGTFDSTLVEIRKGLAAYGK